MFSLQWICWVLGRGGSTVLGKRKNVQVGRRHGATLTSTTAGYEARLWHGAVLTAQFAAALDDGFFVVP
jgi:hypothetical protein